MRKKHLSAKQSGIFRSCVQVAGGSKRSLSVHFDLSMLKSRAPCYVNLSYLHSFKVETAVLLRKTQGSAFVLCSELNFKIGIEYALSQLELETREMKMQVGNVENLLFNHIRTQ